MIIPFSGVLKDLQRQLGALNEQTLRDWEFEVIVACNSMTSLSSMRQIQFELERDLTYRVLILDATQKRGASFARNVGVANASSQFLLFCDADDFVGRAWVENMGNALLKAVAVGGSLEYSRLNRPGTDKWNFNATLSLPRKFHHAAFAQSCNLGIRQAVFKSCGGYDEGLETGEDVDLCWRLQDLGHKLAFEPSALVSYKIREGFLVTLKQFYKYAVNDYSLLKKHMISGAKFTFWDYMRECLSCFVSFLGLLIGISPAEKFAARLGTVFGRVTWLWQ